jgi:hypothetical protein
MIPSMSSTWLETPDGRWCKVYEGSVLPTCPNILIVLYVNKNDKIGGIWKFLEYTLPLLSFSS